MASKRTRVYSVRFGIEEEKQLKATAKALHLTYSGFIRYAVSRALDTSDTEWDLLFRRLNKHKKELAVLQDQFKLLLGVQDYTLAHILRLVDDAPPTSEQQWTARYDKAMKTIATMHANSTSRIYRIATSDDFDDDSFGDFGT